MKTISRHRQRGTVLMTVLILLVTGSLISIGLCQYMMAMVRLDERRADSLKAFYIAESGINRVVDFFNHPDEYPDATPGNEGGDGGAVALLSVPMPQLSMAGFGSFSLKSPQTSMGPIASAVPMLASATAGESVSDDQRLFYFDKDTGTFPNLESQLDQGDVVLDETIYPAFTGANGLFGHVEDITLSPSQQGDPSNCFARMSSTGVTASGVRKTVSVFLLSGNPAASSPAALISKNAAQFSGNVEVRWGEVWVRNMGVLPNWNKWGNYVDPADSNWTSVKTNDLFTFSEMKYLDGSKFGISAPITDPSNPRYINPCAPTAELDIYNGRILQHQNLLFPEFNYDEYKRLALRRGDYYSTDASSRLFRRDGSLVTDVYAELWRVNPSSTDLRFVFIDTIDKQAPRADGSNLATLPLSGNSPHSKGLYYLNVNLDASGMGNPPELGVRRPDGVNVELSKVWHVGIIYVSGTMIGVGNSRVYGSVIAERGLTEAGTPSVYYDKRLSDATFMPLNSLVSVRLYDIR